MNKGLSLLQDGQLEGIALLADARRIASSPVREIVDRNYRLALMFPNADIYLMTQRQAQGDP